MTYFCCEVMQQQLEKTCDIHSREECPDCILDRWSNGTIGMMVKDGGSSMIVFNYCPWCRMDIRVEGEEYEGKSTV